MRILAINPGSTSTKIAVYEDETPVMLRTINHSAQDVAQFKRITDQFDYRLQLILDTLAEEHQPLDFDAVMGRGGLAKPLESGVYNVNEQMLHDMWNAEHQHACDLGCILAYNIAKRIPGCKAMIADPGAVDEMNDYAHISGSPLAPRICIWHALNQKATARKYAAAIGRRYEDLNLIVCHLGGGISVAAHDHGRAVDANDSLSGEGPFSPERAGTLPASQIVKLAFSGRYTEEQLIRRLAGKAGLNAHLGTNDVRQVIARIEDGDEHARLILDAMIYHTAKAIAACGAVLCGKVDAIILTGGIAYSDYIISRLRPRIEWIAPVAVYPGENEMEALASNGLAVLRGEREAKPYV